MTFFLLELLSAIAQSKLVEMARASKFATRTAHSPEGSARYPTRTQDLCLKPEPGPPKAWSEKSDQIRPPCLIDKNHG